jgi:hypothetical protein
MTPISGHVLFLHYESACIQMRSIFLAGGRRSGHKEVCSCGFWYLSISWTIPTIAQGLSTSWVRHYELKRAADFPSGSAGLKSHPGKLLGYGERVDG